MFSKSTILLSVLMGVAMLRLLSMTLFWPVIRITKTQQSGHLLCAEAPSTFVKTT